SLAEGDVDARAARVAEPRQHRQRLLRRAAQEAVAWVLAEVRLEDLLAARGTLGVGAEVEAEVHGAEDGPGMALLRLAPLVEDPALVDPLVGPDVGRVPAVGEPRGGAERALLTATADPDGHARLERLGIVRRVLQPEVRAREVRAARLGVEEHAHH